MMSHGPVGPASPAVRKPRQERVGADGTGKNDFGKIMEERHPRIRGDARQVREEKIELLAIDNKPPRAVDEGQVAIAVPAIFLLDRHLTVHHIAPDDQVEPPHGIPKFEQQHARKIHRDRSDNEALVVGSALLEKRDREAVGRERKCDGPEMPQLVQAPLPIQRQTRAMPELLRIADNPADSPTGDNTDPLHADLNFKSRRSDNIPRLRAERGNGSGGSAPHEWAGSQREAPANGAVIALAQPLPNSNSDASPAEQISRHLSEAVSNSVNEPRAPLPGTAIRSLKIILEPEQLGIVHISLAMKADGLHVRIAASETGTADMLRKDRYQLDSLLRPLAGDGLMVTVTIAIEPLRETAETFSGRMADQHPQANSADLDFRHSGSNGAGNPDDGDRANATASNQTDGSHEDTFPAHPHQHGVVVV